MDVKIPLTKLVPAFIILSFLSKRKGNPADQSAFFARQKWTLEDVYIYERQAKRMPTNGEGTDPRA
jgi:hypothetical protein